MDYKQLRSTTNKAIWVLGILAALGGALLMWVGTHLGNDLTSPGRTIGIMGIVAIGAARAAMRRERTEP